MSGRPVSQQKARKNQRPLASHQIEALLLERVRSASAPYAVLKLEMEFAGYFNSLGFRLDFLSTATDSDVLDASNCVLEAVREATAGIHMLFTWSAGFYRDGDLLQVIDAHSLPRWRCSDCGTELNGLLTDCSICGRPRD